MNKVSRWLRPAAGAACALLEDAGATERMESFERCGQQLRYERTKKGSYPMIALGSISQESVNAKLQLAPSPSLSVHSSHTLTLFYGQILTNIRNH